MPDPFLVMATQNPIESEGTYPLPEAQVDRFMLKIVIGYPAHDEELTIVQRQLVAAPRAAPGADARRAARAPARDRRRLRRPGADQLRGRARDRDARRRPATASPSSPTTSPSAPARAGRSAVVQAARALALLRGRDYVVAEDLHELAKDALRHRLVLTYQALAEEVTPTASSTRCSQAVPVPQVDLARTSAA